MKIEVELTDNSISGIVLKDLRMCLEFALLDKDDVMIEALTNVIKLYEIPSEFIE